MEKVLLLTDSLGAGGAQRQLCGLAIFLQQEGYDVKVLTYYEIDFYKSLLDNNSVPNEIILNAVNPIKRIIAVYKYFKKENPDYVIAYQETPSLLACISKLLGCRYKLIVSERNTTQNLTIRERIRFYLYRFAQVIVPNSFSQERFLLDHYDWMKDKVVTITNYVDLDHFSFKAKEKGIRALLLVVATVWPPKNTLGFIQALAILVDRGYSFKVKWYGVVSGHEDYVEKCTNMISQNCLEDYIELLPKTKEIANQYVDCDFFCLPSFYEGTPNVIGEAMAVGRPIICSDVCDNPVYVQDSVNGYLFDADDYHDIADKIEKALLMSSDRYKSMCVKSRELAEKLLSKETFINKYLDILQK